MSQAIGTFGTLSQVGLAGGAAVLGVGGIKSLTIGGELAHMGYSKWSKLNPLSKASLIIGVLAFSILGLSSLYTAGLVGRVAFLGIGSLSGTLKPLALALVSGLVMLVASRGYNEPE